MNQDSVSQIIEKAKEDDVKFIDLWFTDFFGSVKSTTMTIENLEEILTQGVWFDGSSIEGFARIHESDMILKPDPLTYSILPWRPREKATARFICDIYKPDGTPFEGDPRYILRKTAEEARKMGYTFNTGPECEFFLFKMNGGPTLEPVTHDFAGYFDNTPRDLASDVRRNIVFALEEMGLQVEMSHHEVAPGQHEIAFKYADSLKTADNTITLKTATKAVAHSMGLHATFMPKPIFGQNGSGMHTHQSLFDHEGKNAFYDSADKYKLSKTAKHFIAGQLKHVKAITAVVAPTINSYKRLVPGYEAPVYICWANVNRSALIRVPKYVLGKENSTRCEIRCPDPSCNPYLAFAAMLKAGLDGIKQQMRIPEPIEEDVYGFSDEIIKEKKIDTLSHSLRGALWEFENSALMKELFGLETFNKYIEAKMKEWNEFRTIVTNWEKEKYLELL